MVKPVKLLAMVPFNVVLNKLPSCLYRSTRTLIGVLFELTKTNSVAQPPPAANWGKRTAPVPSRADALAGTEVTGARLVTGSVLKFWPRNLSPTTDTGRFDGPADVIASVPITSEGNDEPENNCVTNFETC